MIRTPACLALLLALPACVTSDDPAEGGFFNGVAGIAGGGYDQRVATREAELAAVEAEGEALNAELASLQRELSSLKSRIIQQRAALQRDGVFLSSDAERQVQRVLAAQPTGTDTAQQVADLRKSIADARALSASLAGLAG